MLVRLRPMCTNYWQSWTRENVLLCVRVTREGYRVEPAIRQALRMSPALQPRLGIFGGKECDSVAAKVAKVSD